MVKSTKMHAKKFYAQQSFLSKVLAFAIALVAISSLTWFFYTCISKGFADVDNEAATEEFTGADSQTAEEPDEAESAEENNATEKGSLNSELSNSEVSNNSNEATPEPLTENSNNLSNEIIAEGDGWELTSDGNLNIKGDIKYDKSSYGMVPWYSYRDKIRKITTSPGAKTSSCLNLFSSLTLESIDLSNLDTFEVTDMSNFFAYTNFNCDYVDLTSLYTSNVKNMVYAFEDVNYRYDSEKNGFTLNISTWDTSNTENMNNMFMNFVNKSSYSITSRTYNIKLGTIELDSTKDTDSMFEYANKNNYVTLNIEGSFSNDDNNVIDKSGWMFFQSGFESLIITNWKKFKSKNCREMFRECRTSIIDVSNIDLSSCEEMSYMFQDAVIEEIKLGQVETPDVKNMNGVFQRCSSLKILDVSNWNMSSVVSMTEMFSGCSNLESIDVSKFNLGGTSEQAKGSLSGMFRGCEKLQNINLSSMNTTYIEKIYGMFEGCSSLKTLNLGQNFDMSSLKEDEKVDTSTLFKGCTSLESISFNPKITGDWFCELLLKLDEQPKLNDISHTTWYDIADGAPYSDASTWYDVDKYTTFIVTDSSEFFNAKQNLLAALNSVCPLIIS